MPWHAVNTIRSSPVWGQVIDERRTRTITPSQSNQTSANVRLTSKSAKSTRPSAICTSSQSPKSASDSKRVKKNTKTLDDPSTSRAASTNFIVKLKETDPANSTTPTIDSIAASSQCSTPTLGHKIPKMSPSQLTGAKSRHRPTQSSATDTELSVDLKRADELKKQSRADSGPYMSNDVAANWQERRKQKPVMVRYQQFSSKTASDSSVFNFKSEIEEHVNHKSLSESSSMKNQDVSGQRKDKKEKRHKEDKTDGQNGVVKAESSIVRSNELDDMVRDIERASKNEICNSERKKTDRKRKREHIKADPVPTTFNSVSKEKKENLTLTLPSSKKQKKNHKAERTLQDVTHTEIGAVSGANSTPLGPSRLTIPTLTSSQQASSTDKEELRNVAFWRQKEVKEKTAQQKQSTVMEKPPSTNKNEMSEADMTALSNLASLIPTTILPVNHWMFSASNQQKASITTTTLSSTLPDTSAILKSAATLIKFLSNQHLIAGLTRTRNNLLLDAGISAQNRSLSMTASTHRSNATSLSKTPRDKSETAPTLSSEAVQNASTKVVSKHEEAETKKKVGCPTKSELAERAQIQREGISRQNQKQIIKEARAHIKAQKSALSTPEDEANADTSETPSILGDEYETVKKKKDNKSIANSTISVNFTGCEKDTSNKTSSHSYITPSSNKNSKKNDTEQCKDKTKVKERKILKLMPNPKSSTRDGTGNTKTEFKRQPLMKSNEIGNSSMSERERKGSRSSVSQEQEENTLLATLMARLDALEQDTQRLRAI